MAYVVSHSGGSRNTTESLHSTEMGRSSCLMGHLARMQTYLPVLLLGIMLIIVPQIKVKP